MPPIRCAIFDFGNTLFAHASLSATIAARAVGLGVALSTAKAESIAREINTAAHTTEELKYPRDLDSAVWMQRWEVLYGLADKSVAGLGHALLEDMHDPMTWIPFSDALTTLQQIKAAGIKVGVISNTGWDVRTAFVAHGLDQSVDHFVLSYEVGCTKPDPRIFHTACAALDVEPGEVLMVGDDPRADSGAVAAGLRVLLLPAVPIGTDNGVGCVADLARARP